MKYEERYAFMLLASIINQTEIKVLRKQVDWDTILKIADFHNIICPIYYGMLGLEKDASEECIEQFYQKYRKQLLLVGAYRNTEQSIRWQLERHHIHTLWLTGTESYHHYHKAELGYVRALELMVRKKELPYVHRLMLDMDFEYYENRMGKGIIYKRVPGVQVIVYDEIPIGNKVIKKYLSEPIQKFPCEQDYPYMHELGKQKKYVYTYAKLIEAYIRDELNIREIINVRQYELSLDDDFPKAEIQELWKKAKVQEFMKQIAILFRLWFGESENEECGVALELEEYILSLKENRWLDKELLPQERFRLDFYRRDREREWALRRRQWWFPPRKYMVEFFPILEKRTHLLWFFWIVRLCRYFRYVCSDRLKGVSLKIGTRWLDIKEKWKKLRTRHKKDEQNEEVEVEEQVVQEKTEDEMIEEILSEGTESENEEISQENTEQEEIEQEHTEEETEQEKPSQDIIENEKNLQEHTEQEATS